MTVKPLPAPPAALSPMAYSPWTRRLRWRLLGGAAALLVFGAGFGIGSFMTLPPPVPLAGIAFSGGTGLDVQ